MKRRERNKGQARAEAVQIRESGRHPFGVLDRYVPCLLYTSQGWPEPM